MDCLGGAVCYRLNHDVLVCIGVDVVAKQRHLLAGLGVRDGVLVESLAYLALQTSPDVRVDKRRLLLVLLALQPLLDAIEMDILN